MFRADGPFQVIAVVTKSVKFIPLSFICSHFKVSRSGYYRWLKKPQAANFVKKEKVCHAIKKSFIASDKTYGSPRIYDDLKKQGFKVSENTIAKYMVELGLDARFKKKFKVNTTDSNHNSPIADRLFKVEEEHTLPKGPEEVLAGDITYLKFSDKFLYLAVVMDVFTREIVGWSMQRSLHTKLVLDALGAAMKKTGPDAQVIFHSDRGSQYASEAYRNFCKNYGMKLSMSRKGNCYDNSYVESWFSSLKKEKIYRKKYDCEQTLKADVFDYIEAWYNRRRKHSALGYKSPIEYKQLCQTIR